MRRSKATSDIETMFLAAERTGLKLAIKGRLIAITVVGAWLIFNRNPERAVDIIEVMLLLAGLGILHFSIIGSVFDRKWIKYLFITIDYVLMSVALTVFPPDPSFSLPQIFMFRFDVLTYYYIILAIAAFSFSPGLVLWSGFAGTVGWLSAFMWVRSGVQNPLDWDDAVQSASDQEFLDVFLSQRFVGTGSHLQESLVYFVVAALIALVMFRARKTVQKQIEAERDKNTISHIFGQFVPETVADMMIRDHGVLDPVERDASVLFVDIVGFTKLTETKGPKKTVSILNEYFEQITEIVGKNNGVITQFQGDAVLAVFNVPIQNPAHARSAFDAACEIIKLVREKTFAGEKLSVRIGLNSGPVIAGNVGGHGRQTYTIHGDTVNVAARLESLNKEHNTTFLLSQVTATHLPDVELKDIGDVPVRGHSSSVRVYTVPFI